MKNSFLKLYLSSSIFVVILTFFISQFFTFALSSFITAHLVGTADIALIMYQVKTLLVRNKKLSLSLSVGGILSKNVALIAVLYALTQQNQQKMGTFFVGMTASFVLLIIIGTYWFHRNEKLFHSGAEHATRNVMV